MLTLRVCNDSHAALVREVVVSPLDEHDHAVAKADEIHDVDEQPQQPRYQARYLKLAKVGDRARAPDYRKIALVEILERPGRLSSQDVNDVLRGG
jgi:hypothetical protein